MFTRTNLGIENEHLFHGVDFVVYCEGKEIEGEGSSLDEVFWERVFRENGKSVHCKSMGGKSVVRPLAERVVAEGIRNVIVAMDRDYDDLRGLAIDHPQVFYTFGYSWESDVVLDFQFSPALSLFATTTRRQTIRAEFVTFRDGLSQGLRRICALDYKYIGHHEKLFDRQKPMSIIATPGSSEPFVRASSMLKKAKTLGHFQTAPLPTEQYNTLCGVKSFFGKVVARLVFHWFAYRTKRITGSRKVVYEAFMDVLTNTLDVTSGGRPRNDYYANAIARL
ncbi:DUF4435 domain-containing protein [Thalassobius sp. Cn5-15]|uniref:DUF4435 domain-containing protein n=1 Tax=Thalassobius sp. Cn5-15 TaxID=2917763 RepID=UPI001EF2CDAE|nr:DUF4435 domain-containing protein [Thalassobius sp. Cn5-15]MCG7493298.1 DUF4435 domain-containing protein [Thalassobius sp. Cn5-15]